MLILTYNVSWKSMTGEKGWSLCNSREKNNEKYYEICQNNVVSVFDKYDYDIIALQEAFNYKELILKSKKLKKMKYIANDNKFQDLITFYNPKYKLVGYYNGEFLKNRPYTILIFSDFCFINVHHGHYSFDVLKKKMNVLIKNINVKKIIIAGDFNSQINNFELLFGNQKFYYDKKIIKTCCYDKYEFQVDHIISNYSVPILKTFQTGMASDHKPIIGNIS